jgi:hypothetical protein
VFHGQLQLSVLLMLLRLAVLVKARAAAWLAAAAVALVELASTACWLLIGQLFVLCWSCAMVKVCMRTAGSSKGGKQQRRHVALLLLGRV